MTVEVSSPIEREWDPTEKQKQFISLPFTIFEALYGGSAGSGKSEILLLLPLIYGWHDHPLFKGIILRRTFPELESEIILRSKEWYPHAGGVYNESKRRWTFPRGAVIQFGHAEREEDVRKYDTAQYNYIGWDESTSFTGFQYEYLSFSRVRSRSADLPAIVRSATNPGNVGHAYFRERFVDPWKDGGRLLVDKKTGQKRIFIQARITDNPHILKANPTYIQQLESLPEAEKRAKLLGDWYTFLGQVFTEFRIEPLPDEPEHARHVIPQFEIPHYWPRIVGIDWGYTAYTWIGWAAVAPNGQVVLYDEYAEKEKKTADWISDFINQTGEDRDQVRLIRVCHSASQQRGEFMNILGQLQKGVRQAKFNSRVELAARDRIGGKLLIHEYLRWSPKPDIRKYYGEAYDPAKAEEIFKRHGKRAYDSYLAIYDLNEHVEEVLPKLQFTDNCSLVTKVLPQCVYDETKVEDVKEFDGDDPYDGLRILLGGVKDWMVSDAKTQQESAERDEIIRELALSGNQTAFYRRMEHIEAKSKKMRPISRRRFTSRRRMPYV